MSIGPFPISIRSSIQSSSAATPDSSEADATRTTIAAPPQLRGRSVADQQLRLQHRDSHQQQAHLRNEISRISEENQI
ncbi:unnamed protein product [Cuscuta campestris]|uniref:Uncharacterized protein n=1 Tax=Cuscuta campestris TaxID=132261 RepID=A0A484NBB2_9ASTE|nr:unnamed protein product [Cuscuta campestris]